MAASDHDSRLDAVVRDALPPWTMPAEARARWRERVVKAAAARTGQRADETPSRARPVRWWQMAAVAVVVLGIAFSGSYGTFRLLSDRAVARAWEERVRARTEELLQHPELWRLDPDALARSVGAGRARVVHPGTLTTVSRNSGEVVVPLGPSEVLVLGPNDDVQLLAHSMRHVYWASVAAGLTPVLIAGGIVWVRWRRAGRN